MRIIVLSVVLFLFFSGCNSSSNSDASSSQETNQPQTPIEPNNPSPEVPSNPSSSETNPESNETSPSQPSPEDNQTSSLPITIELSLDTLELKEGSSLPLHVKGIDTHTNLKWTISNPQLVSITNNTLNALKEGNVSLSVSTDNAQSNALHVTVYKEIHGHRLPPEPDETLNNSTLLGIDSNNNGVRDDVERKIYFQYSRPIVQAFMMQSAKSYTKILDNPIVAASSQEIQDDEWNEYSCRGYLEDFKNIEFPDDKVEFLNNAHMNTKERIKAYIEFNEASSGGVYTMPTHDKDLKEENCDFNVEEMLGLGK